MTLLRYSRFVLCIALTTGSYAQERATPLPDAPDPQKPVVGVAPNTKPHLVGRKKGSPGAAVANQLKISQWRLVHGEA